MVVVSCMFVIRLLSIRGFINPLGHSQHGSQSQNWFSILTAVVHGRGVVTGLKGNNCRIPGIYEVSNLEQSMSWDSRALQLCPMEPSFRYLSFSHDQGFANSQWERRGDSQGILAPNQFVQVSFP